MINLPIGHAFDRLRQTADAMIKADGEHIIWRHQLIGQKNPLAETALGVDPAGTYWKTQDYVIGAQRQGEDQMGRSIFYIQAEPTMGDLLITLVGQPKTPQAALHAVRAGFYRVVDFDVRRNNTGQIIYTRCWTVPDRSQHWNDYQFHGGDPMDDPL